LWCNQTGSAGHVINVWDYLAARMSIISSPGIAMPQAGLCFTDVTFFFNVALLIRQRMDGSQRGLLR